MQQDHSIHPGMRIVDRDGAEVGVVDGVATSSDGRSTEITLVGSGDVVVLTSELVDTVNADEVFLAVGEGDLHLTPPTAGTAMADDLPADADASGVSGETLHIERYEERLVPETVRRETGALRIEKRVVEEPQTFSVDVTREEYDVQRVQVDRDWQPGDDQPRNEGDTLIVPIVEERILLTRRKMVTAELRVTKRDVTETRQITETVRKEIVDVTGPDGRPVDTSPST